MHVRWWHNIPQKKSLQNPFQTNPTELNFTPPSHPTYTLPAPQASKLKMPPTERSTLLMGTAFKRTWFSSGWALFEEHRWFVASRSSGFGAGGFAWKEGVNQKNGKKKRHERNLPIKYSPTFKYRKHAWIDLYKCSSTCVCVDHVAHLLLVLGSSRYTAKRWCKRWRERPGEHKDQVAEAETNPN